ncbi:MAG TPA: caspase family protein [Chloroflexia bacterium]
MATQIRGQIGVPAGPASFGPAAKQPGSLGRGRAFIIGINEYSNPRWRLKNAVNDAEAIARALSDVHRYDVTLLRDGEATLAALLDLLKSLKEGPQRVLPNDRMVIYFAGHGLGYSDRGEFKGALLPQDVQLGVPTTYLDMQRLFQELDSLECRHLLLVLDCCFAGLARAAMRDVADTPPLYKEQYYRFLKDKAWQLLTSAGESQRASDGDSRLGRRSEASGGHSPFAAALLKALESNAADCRTEEREPDYIVIAPELYQYVRYKVEQFSFSQTPGLWPLPKHGTGEYFFLLPGFDENRLEAAPELDRAKNPYRGAATYLDTHAEIFFGRHELAHELETLVAGPLTVLVGPSAAGKTSLVQAGLIPRLRKHKLPRRWQGGNLDLRGQLDGPGGMPVLPLPDLPPHVDPAAPLDARLRAWDEAHSETLLLLIVDHCEEFFIRGRERQAQQFFAELSSALTAHKSFLRILLVVRADMEPKLKELVDKQYWTSDAVCVVPPMQQDDLRVAIVEPAKKSVLFFDPEDSVDSLINDLGPALPWVSRTLSELYTRTWQRWQAGDRSRVLKYEDYLDMGSITGVLSRQAEAVYKQFGEPVSDGSAPSEPGKKQAIMQRVLLRMIDTDDAGADYGVRWVPLNELDYDTDQEVREVVERLAEAHLIVIGRHRTGEAYAMPAHPKLIQGWHRLREWRAAAEAVLPLRLHRKLTRDALDWERTPPGRPEWLLWAGGSNLTGVEQALNVAPERLNQLERDFATASVELRERNERARKRRMMALVGLTITSLIAAVIAWLFAGEAQLQTRQAQREARLARVGQLNTQVRTGLDDLPIQSLLLSIEAITTTMSVGEPPLPAAQELLYTGLSQVGGKGLSGHTARINSVAISSDNHWLASGSDDTTIRLWDLTAPDPANHATVLFGAIAPISRLVFSPNNNWLVAGSGSAYSHESDILLWNLAHGGPPLGPIALRRSMSDGDKTERYWERMAFSPDSRWLSILRITKVDGERGLAEKEPNEVCLWDLAATNFDPDCRALPIPRDINPYRPDPIGDTCADAPIVSFPGDLGDEFTSGCVGGSALEPAATATLGGDPGTYPPPLIVGGNTDSDAPGDESGGENSNSPLPTPTVLLPTGAAPDSRYLPVTGPQATLSDLGPVVFSLDSQWLTVLGSSGIALWNLNDLGVAPLQVALTRVLAVSTDGRWVVSAHVDGSMQLWDRAGPGPAPTPRRFGETGAETLPQGAGISPDGRWLAMISVLPATNSQTPALKLYLWDLTATDPRASEGLLDQRPLAALEAENLPELAFSPDGRWLVVQRFRASLEFWDLEERSGRKYVAEVSERLAVFSSTGRWMVGDNSSDASNKSILLWEFFNSGPKAGSTVLGGHEGSVYAGRPALAFSADDRWLAVGDTAGMVRLWDMTLPTYPEQPVRLGGTAQGQDATLLGAAFSADANELLTFASSKGSTPGSLQYSARYWDLSAKNPVLGSRSPGWHSPLEGFPISVELSPDGRWLLTRSFGELTLCDLEAASPAATKRTLRSYTQAQASMPPSMIESTLFSRDSRWLLDIETAGDVFLWDLTAADPIATVRRLPRNIKVPPVYSETQHHAYGRWIAIKIDDHTLNILDLEQEDPIASRRVLDNSSWGFSQAVSPDGRWLATGGPGEGESTSSEPAIIEVRDLKSISPTVSRPTFTLEGGAYIKLLGFSYDSRWLTDGTHLWDMDSTPKAGRAYALANPEEGSLAGSATFSRNGKWLATVSAQGTLHGVRLYDLTTANPGTDPITFSPPPGMGSGTPTFSADGRWLIMLPRQAESVYLWPLDARELIEQACRTAGRNLTPHEWQQYVGSGEYRKTCPDLP